MLAKLITPPVLAAFAAKVTSNKVPNVVSAAYVLELAGSIFWASFCETTAVQSNALPEFLGVPAASVMF